MTSELPVPPEYIGFMRNIIAGNFKAAARYIWLNPVLKEHLKSLLFTEIKLEAQDICSNKESSFRLNNINELKEKLCSQKQKRELEDRCPMLLQALYSAGCNETQVRVNKIKTKSTLTKRLMAAAGIIFNCYNERMNTHQVMNSMILKRAGTKKMGFQRLHKRSITLSYIETLKRQTALGTGYDKKVKDWMEQLTLAIKNGTTDQPILQDPAGIAEVGADSNHSIKESCGECEIIEQPDQGAVQEKVTEENISNERSTRSYRIIGDNCDMRTKCRSTGRNRSSKDLHLFLTLAMRDRVVGDPKSVFGFDKEKRYCRSTYLPNLEDNKHLRDEFKILVGRTLKKHVPELDWLNKYVPDHIGHKYTREMTRKSEIVSNSLLHMQ